MSATLQPSKPIDFMLVAYVDELRFIPDRAEGIRFRFESTAGEVLISLRPPDTESSGFDGLECKARISKVASPTDWRFISSIIERRFEAYEGMPISLPYSPSGRVEIDEKGNIRDDFGVPFELFPESVRNFCDTAQKELGSAMKRFLKLLRWQQNLDGPHSLFEFGPTLYWKILGETYTYVAVKSQAGQLRTMVGIKWEEIEEAEFQSLWEKEDADEPLAHELLREAKTLLGTSPRSALLVTAAALEAGVKHHVALLATETAWLLTEMPSPPVFRLLRDFVPILYRNRGTELEHWSNLRHLFRACQKLAEDRNELTHTGQMNCDTATVERYMFAVSDVLYIFDVLSGHEWAKEHVEVETRKVLGWPGPRRQRLIATFRTGYTV